MTEQTDEKAQDRAILLLSDMNRPAKDIQTSKLLSGSEKHMAETPEKCQTQVRLLLIGLTMPSIIIRQAYRLAGWSWQCYIILLSGVYVRLQVFCAYLAPWTSHHFRSTFHTSP